MNHLNQMGKNIKRHREKMGITQADLAERLFVSFQAVSAWERGQSVPDLENAVRLANIFEISLDTLLKDTGEEIYVGIDGGGTKTEFCAFLADGTVKKRLIKGASNPNDLGEEASLSVLFEGLDQILQGISPKGIFAGIAGASVGKWKSILASRLRERYVCPSFVDTDAANVLSLAEDPDQSAMVICGTGSCVFVRRGEKVFRLGGWGQLFDESGSAYDVGKDAIRHTLAVRDGLEKESLLVCLVEKELGGSVFEGLSAVYKKGRPYIASLAHLVVEGEKAGDEICHSILEKNARRLGLLLRTAKERYGAEVFVFSGGFFKNEVFLRMVEREGDCCLYDPGLPPVYGACVEVFRRMGEEIPTAFRENFEESFGRHVC